MIAGETESILFRNRGVDQYDHFSFFGKNRKGKPKKVKKSPKIKKVKKTKKELTPEEQEARRTRRRNFWSTLGSSLKEGGNVIEMFNGRSDQPVPEDFQINLGDDNGLSSFEENKKKEKEEEDEKGKSIPTPAIIIGGVLVLSLLYLSYLNYQSSQESNRLQS